MTVVENVVAGTTMRRSYESIRTNDPMERLVEQALIDAGLRYRREGDPLHHQTIDYLLLDHDVHIEVKLMHTDRVSRQMASVPNIIVAQGEPAIRLLARAIRDGLLTPVESTEGENS